jgi:hypothetical protein
MKVEAGSTGNPEGGRFNELFHQRRHVLLPVIHVENGGQAMRNARLAREHGCPGVFLINHGISSTELLEVHDVVRRTFPGWFVGLNLLDLSPSDAIASVSLDTAGLWVDNAMIDEREAQQPRAGGVLEARRRSGWGGLYFGGVAFKYHQVPKTGDRVGGRGQAGHPVHGRRDHERRGNRDRRERGKDPANEGGAGHVPTGHRQRSDT